MTSNNQVRHVRTDLMDRAKNLPLESKKNENGTYTVTVKHSNGVKADGPNLATAIRNVNLLVMDKIAKGDVQDLNACI